jgi:hypothetical protein
VSDLAVSLLRFTSGLDVPIDAALRVTLAVARKLPRSTPEERAQAVRSSVSALAPFQDWSGAAALLRSLGDGQKLGAAAFTSELSALCARLRSSGEDLYRGIAILARGLEESGAEGGAKDAEPPR